jgi:hypothetical protein
MSNMKEVKEKDQTWHPVASVMDELERIEQQTQPIVTAPPADTALDFLKSVYRNPAIPLPTRMKAAIEALPFENPKLSATAFMPVRDFAAILDERLKRAKAVEAGEPMPKLIDAKPVV